MIYLDNSATTKPHPSVLRSYNQVSESFFANPSSIHQLGAEAEKLLQKAKEQVAQIFHVAKDEIIFTSGGTEGNNMAIKGIALQHRQRGKHIITSQIEHPSVYDACQSLEAMGYDITYLPVDCNGVVSANDVSNAIREDTILISIMHVNNEIGSIQPVQEIGELAKKHPKLSFHVDHVQGLGKVPLQLSNSGIDLCTMSGHKIHGLKGTGILYIANRSKLFPLFHGGSQERSIRSGTENLAGAVAIVKAIRMIDEREKQDKGALLALRNYAMQRIAELDNVVINTSKLAAPHIINFSVIGLKPEVLIHALGEKEIFISTKSACSSKLSDESRVLAALGFDSERTISGLRVSMSYDTTKEELNTFIIELEKAIKQLKKVVG
ncbi:cysteine desulfurase family protein [Virgibacillus necropolis]|uniref:Cysteine desulfurase NifS n=1 Tax=Virgibacillus necropolis TaxID=163877 RepID=A0A221MBC4_9BACI|nr:cysteine desulfurase family protein [Virgibacillus necropolis]ASN04976.1 cysteine desulfurase NifS [Virgibacillus necropolis]